jgi:hypothetical protein
MQNNPHLIFAHILPDTDIKVKQFQFTQSGKTIESTSRKCEKSSCRNAASSAYYRHGKAVFLRIGCDFACRQAGERVE